MKKLVMIVCCSFAAASFAGPGPHHRPGPGPRPGGHHWAPPPPPRHHAPHGGHWGHDGRNFWPGFVGGIAAGAAWNAMVTPRTYYYNSSVVAPAVVAGPTVVAPTYVAQPVAVTQRVWIPGRFVEQVCVNGAVVRVWQPGHYEIRTVYQ